MANSTRVNFAEAHPHASNASATDAPSVSCTNSAAFSTASSTAAPTDPAAKMRAICATSGQRDAVRARVVRHPSASAEPYASMKQ